MLGYMKPLFLKPGRTLASASATYRRRGRKPTPESFPKPPEGAPIDVFPWEHDRITACGRYLLALNTEEIAKAFDIKKVSARWEPAYNISPSQSSKDPPLIVRERRGGKRELVNARWSLIPSWWKGLFTTKAGDQKLAKAFNAKADVLTTSRFFAEPFTSKRCLVPVTGFYAFADGDGGKDVFHFHLAGHRPFAIAGVWNRWRFGGQSEWVESFAIIMVKAKGAAAGMFSYVPAILDPGDYDAWLDRDNDDADGLLSLLKSPKRGTLLVYHGTRYVNHPANQSRDCLRTHAEYSWPRPRPTTAHYDTYD